MEYLQTSDDTKQYARDAESRISSACPPSDVSVFTKCATEIIQATEEAQTAKHDLSQQREMAVWARLMFWVSAGMAVLTAIGVWFVYGTLVATRDTLKEAEKTSQAALLSNEIIKDEQRAWLHIDIAEHLEINVEPTHIEFIVSASIANLGKSPAIKVCPFFFVGSKASDLKTKRFDPRFDESEWPDVPSELLGIMSGRACFPGKELPGPKRYSTTVHKEEFEADRGMMMFSKAGMFSAVFVVYYTSVGSLERRYTEVEFSIWHGEDRKSFPPNDWSKKSAAARAIGGVGATRVL